MNPRDYSAIHRDIKSTEPEANNTPEERQLALKFVVRHTTDTEDRQEILLALGLADPDFHWIQIPSSHKRRKFTVDGLPYPSKSNGDAHAPARVPPI